MLTCHHNKLVVRQQTIILYHIPFCPNKDVEMLGLCHCREL